MSDFHAATKIRCRCRTCGKRFTIITQCGKSHICDACTIPLLEIIYGRKITGRDKFGVIVFERNQT